MNKDLTSNPQKEIKKHSENLFDSIKKKAIEFGIDYLKKNFSFSKQDIAKYVERYVERQIERKIKSQIRKYLFIGAAFFLLVIGGLFLFYFCLNILVIFLQIPLYLTNFLFSLFLILFGVLIYLMSK